MKLEACKGTRKRIAVIGISSVVLVLIVVVTVVGTSHSNEGSHNGGGSQFPTPMASIKAVCDTTLYPDTCMSSLSPLANKTNI